MHPIPKLECFSSSLAVVFAQAIEAMCLVEKDVVGAAPAGDAPTISEWSTILLPTKVHLISEVWGQVNIKAAGILPFCVARPSGAMALSVQHKPVLAFHSEGFYYLHNLRVEK